MLLRQSQRLGILGNLRGSATRQVISLRTFSQAAAQEGDDSGVSLTESAIQRLQHLLATKARPDEKALRLTVEAGGCSGFSYRFDLDQGPKEGDAVYAYNGAQLVVDSVSLEFVRGATIDYAAELIKSNFEVVQNPNAEGSCGCGSSFNPKGM
ncbi:g12342 [Coccomyxa viridis]|uniref:G12342 protein n=1 Tax=Coccomyxa viridis TaxID=1274662 RepID=A0ABP1GA43_9CHLO